MRLLISTAIALTAALVATGPAIDLAAAPNRPKNIPVSVTFRDGAGDRILSDNGGDYVDGVGGVVAYIAGSSQQLIFGSNVSKQAGRTLQFQLDDCVSNCEPTWTYLDEKAGLQAGVLGGGPLAMAVGEERNMFVKFNIPLDSDPGYYNVCFDGGGVMGPCAAPPVVNSTDAYIRRDAPDRWTVFASGSDRGDFIQDLKIGKSRTFTLMGTYSMPFQFTLQCVNAGCS